MYCCGRRLRQVSTPHIVEMVFVPYFTTKKAGNGLGLASSKAIMYKNKASIAVESTVGEGTTVILTIFSS